MLCLGIPTPDLATYESGNATCSRMNQMGKYAFLLPLHRETAGILFVSRTLNTAYTFSGWWFPALLLSRCIVHSSYLRTAVLPVLYHTQ